MHLADAYFPDHWGGLVDTINNFNSSDDSIRIRAGLLMTKQLFSLFEHQDKKELVAQLIEALFGNLINVYTQAVERASSDQAAQYFVLQILKIFYLTCQLRLPLLMQNPADNYNTFRSWYSLLQQAYVLELPESFYAIPSNEIEQEQLESEVLWMIKD